MIEFDDFQEEIKNDSDSQNGEVISRAMEKAKMWEDYESMVETRSKVNGVCKLMKCKPENLEFSIDKLLANIQYLEKELKRYDELAKIRQEICGNQTT